MNWSGVLGWTADVTEEAARQLARLDRPIQHRILRFLRERVETAEDPRSFGRALQGRHSGLWRYRVGDYRLICQLRDSQRIMLVVTLGHRREVYRLSNIR